MCVSGRARPNALMITQSRLVADSSLPGLWTRFLTGSNVKFMFRISCKGFSYPPYRQHLARVDVSVLACLVLV